MLETENEVFKAVSEAKLDLQSAPWLSISPSAKDLVRKMLTVDPRKRITAADAIGNKSMKLLVHIICTNSNFSPSNE